MAVTKAPSPQAVSGARRSPSVSTTTIRLVWPARSNASTTSVAWASASALPREATVISDAVTGRTALGRPARGGRPHLARAARAAPAGGARQGADSYARLPRAHPHRGRAVAARAGRAPRPARDRHAR